MLHFDGSHNCPGNCTEQGGNPAKGEVHAVVGGGVVEEYIHNQDVVQMKTLGNENIFYCLMSIKILFYLQKHPMKHCCP